MTRTIPPARLLAAGALAALAALTLAVAAQGGPSAPPAPASLEVPAGHKLFLVTHATGVQIYACRAAGNGYEWVFVAPRADVHGANGKLVATHFGGPTWLARDGSSVVGRVVQRVPVTGTIPLLLLEAASTATGPDGDRLAGTTHIQRLATTGGAAPPASECTEATAGTTAEVPYTADYTFWKAVGEG